MTTYNRKQKRISTDGLGLAGELILHPDPQPIKSALIDISDEGAGIRLAGSVNEEQRKMLELLVRNAQAGKRTPVAFSFNNSKFPIIIMNTWNSDCYGFIINESGHQQLASLAERGRSFFQDMVQGAIRKGAKESGFIEYPVLSLEFLPPDIRAFVESLEFIALFMPVLTATIIENIPGIRGSISSPQDRERLQGVLFRFLKAQGKDIHLLMGAALHFMRLREAGISLENLVGPAAKHLFDDDRLIGFEEQARLRDIFLEELANRQRGAKVKVAADAKSAADAAPREVAAPAALFTAIPEKHPLAGVIKARFEAFSRKIFFIPKLAPVVTDHYFNTFIPRDHEMIEIAKADPRLVKTMLPRWVQNELQEISGNKERGMQGVIEEHFRLAIFEYMMGRRLRDIGHEEIHDLFEGKISPEFGGVRGKFLNTVCDFIHAGILERFGDFRTDIDYERSKKLAEKENELRIARLHPDDLTKEFLWSKVVERGEIFPLQREFAKAWLASDTRLISISALGSVVVVPSGTFKEFAKLVDKYASEGVKASDFFVRVDLGEMYRSTTKMRDGTEIRDAFGLYLDTLLPKVARENCLNKVINNEVNCVYYVLNKSKSQLAKAFGIQAPQAIDLIDRSMLTVKEEAKNFI